MYQVRSNVEDELKRLFKTANGRIVKEVRFIERELPATESCEQLSVSKVQSIQPDRDVHRICYDVEDNLLWGYLFVDRTNGREIFYIHVHIADVEDGFAQNYILV